MPDRIAVVGVTGPDTALGKEAQRALEAADLVVGGRRHLDAFAPAATRRLVVGADVGSVLDAIADHHGSVCVLASGDPGFFGMVRPLAERFGREALDVHPAPSSVALAFARIGLPWDDAVVVSAHGRPLADAADTAARAPKAAVLASPENPPEAVGAALIERGARHDLVVVCSSLGLGLDREQVVATDLGALAAGSWEPLSVVVLASGDHVARSKRLAWGLADEVFDHRAGMITKSEVRAVAVSKLELPETGTLWDVGAGSGSVGIECARLAPRLAVHAVERRSEDARRIAANALRHSARVTVHAAEAPAALAALPDPDRAFVGGGGIDVLDAVLARLQPGGRVVATYAALDRAAAAAERLGALVQVSVSRGERLPDKSFRLAAANPVFVVWGPTP